MARVHAAISYAADTAPPGTSAQTPRQLQQLRQLDPASGIGLRPGRPRLAIQRALDTPLSRSRSTPASSGSPHTVSGRTTPATVWHRASGPTAKWLRSAGNAGPSPVFATAAAMAAIRPARDWYLALLGALAFALAAAGRDCRRHLDRPAWRRWPGHVPHIIAMGAVRRSRPLSRQ
jgi:hypothetical protein